MEIVGFLPQTFVGVAFFFNLQEQRINFLLATDLTDKSGWTSGNLYQQGVSQEFPTTAQGFTQLLSIELEYINLSFTIRMIFSNGNFTMEFTDNGDVQRLVSTQGSGFCSGGAYGFGYWQRTIPVATQPPSLKNIVVYQIEAPVETTTAGSTESPSWNYIFGTFK